MAYKLQLKRGASGSLPTGSAGEPLFTTDTNDLYIGTGAANQRFQKYIASGTSSQFLKGDGSLDSNTYYLASNPSAYIALTALTASAPLSYNNTTGAFTIAQASGSVNGFLSSTDWTTFNNKQNALTNPVTGTGTTNYLPKWTSGSAIGNSLVYDNGTNVLIGKTTDTIGKLQVAGAGGLMVNEDGLGTKVISIRSDFAGVDPSINVSTNNALLFQTNNTERARFTSGGNLLVNSTTDNGNRLQVTGNGYFSGSVGVGTSSPAALLHVNSTGTHTFVYSTISGSSAIALDNQGGDLRIFTGGAERMRLNSFGNLGLGVTPSAWSLGKAFEINSAGNNIWSYSNDNIYLNQNSYFNSGWKYGTSATAAQYILFQGSHLWQIAPSGTAGNAITFTQAMTLTSGGNLLIGTTTDAGYKLDVNGTGRFSGDLTLSSGGDRIFSINDTGGNLFQIQAASNILYYSARSTGGSLAFRTNGTNDVKLSIASTGAATFSSSVSTGTLSLSGSTFQSSGDFYIGTNNANLIQFYTSNANRMIITPTGNVGIGTTSPTTGRVVISQTGGTQLHLISGDSFGTTDVLLRLTSSNDYRGRGIWMDNSGTTGAWYAGVPYNGGCYSIGYDATQPEITANSKFLITTTGAATFSSSVTAGGDIVTPTRVAVDMINGYTGGSTPITIRTGGAQDIVLGTNTTERMRITSGGNLLVGTTTDAGYKLFVNGDIGAGAASQIYLTSGDLRFNSNAGFGIVSQNGSRLVTIQNGAFGVTGAATFSSSVTATDFIGNLEASNIRINQTLSTSSSGASGNFLTININGTLYKLQLLNT